MLATVDRILAPLSWVLAGLTVIALIVGPLLLAEDETEPRAAAAGAAPYAAAAGSDGGAASAPAAADGKAVFSDNCGGCHTLSDAGASGIAGPSLDGAGLDAETVAGIVRGGRGGMPAFGDSLSAAQIQAVADYVAEASGS